MSTRESTVGVTSTRSAQPDLVVSGLTPPAAPHDAPGDRGPSARRRAVAIVLVLGVVALAAVAAAVGGMLAGDSGSTVAAPRAQQPAEVPAPPAPLEVSVAAPAVATVGEPVQFTVTWSDGSGFFSGTSEEWGDGVGTSSVQEGTCPSTKAAAAQSDTYSVTHTFTSPGTYTVALGVHSWTCSGATAVQEKATVMHTVEVAAR